MSQNESGLIGAPEKLEIIRCSEATVEANLAIDNELVADAARSGKRTMRLWWGDKPTAVLGCGDKPEVALNLDECKLRGIDWVKRITGGATVLQTPGVLNYSYTAPDYGRLDMDRLFRQGAELIVSVLAGFGVSAQQRGISDVAVGDLKISGNAQARRRRGVLLHGTLIVDIDRDLMGAIIRHPQKEPSYRQGRAHSDFVVTLNDLGVAADKEKLEDAFTSSAVEVFTLAH